MNNIHTIKQSNLAQMHNASASHGFRTKLVSSHCAHRKPFMCRASSDGTRSILQSVKKRVPKPQNQTYLETAEYLRETLQFSNMTEMTRVLDLAMNPNSLFGTRQGKRGPTNPHARKLSVDDDVRPVVEWLFDQGLDKKGALRVLVDHPPVLCYSIKERLQPFMDLLTSTRVGLTREEAVTLLQKRANILGLDPENLNRIVSFLVDQHGVSREDMLGMLEKSL